MKLVHTAEFGIGVARGRTAPNHLGELGEIVDVSPVFSDVRYHNEADRMQRILAVFPERREQVERLAESGDPVSSATVLAPVVRPPKLIACLRNYFEGVQRERETQDMFLESPDSVTSPGKTVVLPPHPATIFHHEAELALVIGRRARDLPADERAYDALAGYTCAIDVSGRGLGRSSPSRIGKSFRTFTPLGPVIVTPDEIPDPQNLEVTLSVDSAVRQAYNTSDMEYPVVEVLAFISSYMTLVPGDVIMCGTNHQGLGPLQDGNRVVCTISGIGSLEVDVMDEQKRSWPYEIDQEIAARTRGEAT